MTFNQSDCGFDLLSHSTWSLGCRCFESEVDILCACVEIYGSSLFGSAVDEKEGNLRLQAVPETTKSAANWGISVWKEWVTARSVKAADGRCSVSTPLLAMPVDDLAYCLRKFVLETRKKDGTEYRVVWVQLALASFPVLSCVVTSFLCQKFVESHRNEHHCVIMDSSNLSFVSKKRLKQHVSPYRLFGG